MLPVCYDNIVTTRLGQLAGFPLITLLRGSEDGMELVASCSHRRRFSGQLPEIRNLTGGKHFSSRHCGDGAAFTTISVNRVCSPTGAAESCPG